MAISGWGIFLIAFFVVAVLSAGAFILYTRYKANKQGLPPPSLNPFSRNSRQTDPTVYQPPAPAPGGIQGWISDKWARLQNNTRIAGGAYESSTGYDASGARPPRRGLGPLDPDEAWDARVDHEMGAYYEEDEVGGGGGSGAHTLHDVDSGPYGGGGYGAAPQAHLGQGRIDQRYEEEVRAGKGGAVAARAVTTTDQARRGRSADPFGDGAERSDMSLRAVSPRPDAQGGGGKRPQGHRRAASSLTVGGGSNEGSPTERKSMFHENM